ncbi:MAG: hypothetical protein JSU96_10660 [Acidobacteriota bacterium]|nr:MAG: hypothetical protein JSU96_10660 [Acidobacteriota bacterium]
MEGAHLGVGLLLAGLCVANLFGGNGDDPRRWEEEIARFEASDRTEGIQKGQILFIGSSSIRKWDLRESFPELDTLNRGFGGSQISDSLHYLKRVVFPYEPRMIVFYAGDNDINAGESPEQVFDDFKRFCRNVHDQLPNTRILFISIKPSLDRWGRVNQMRDANRRIARLAGQDPLVGYVDIDTLMIGEDGRPRPELFDSDGLHLNDAGYRVWAAALRPFLN